MSRSYLSWTLGGLLLVVLIVGIISMPAEECRADPQAMRAEAINIINTGALGVPEVVAKQFSGTPGKYFVENAEKQRLFSKYGVLNDFVSIPPLVMEKWITGRLPYVSPVEPGGVRVLLLNLYNILLSLLSACYLFVILCRYTRSLAAISIFILTAFYCTYWWNYLRIQSSEIYQALFMLGFFHHVTALFHARDAKTPRGDLILAGVFLGALFLVKSVYVAVVPAIVIALLFFLVRRARLQEGAVTLKSAFGTLSPMMWVLAPATVGLLILLAVNNYKFGSPLESGYSQWGEMGKPLFSGNIGVGLHGMLVSPHGSIFVAFPILVVALFGYRRFWKNFSADLLLAVAMALTLLLLHARLLNYLGEWCYGPRYMLVVLPLVSLPYVLVLERLVAGWRSAKLMACSVVLAAMLGFSFFLQLEVNSVPFFAYFEILGAFEPTNDPQFIGYFEDRPAGLVILDVKSTARGENTEFGKSAGPYVHPQLRERFLEFLRYETKSNYYLFR